MTSPTGDVRPLQYPLNRSADIESETPDEPVFNLSLDGWETNDPDERVDVVLRVSLNEYAALSTCVDVGRDLAYGDNSIYLWWLWTRSLLSMSICDSIITCINDAESGVASAILDVVNANNFSDSVVIAQSQNGMVLGDGFNPTCDLDILYGQARQLVSYLHAINLDILEILEVATNLLDAAGDVVGDITFVDESNLDALISYVAWLQDNIAENYLAQVTETYLEDVACEIFCAARVNNCEITPELLWDVWEARLEAGLSIAAIFANTVGFLIAGTWVGTQIADAMFLSQLMLRSQVGKVLNISAYFDLNSRLVIYSNDPNPDWSTLCTDCTYDILVTFDSLSTDEFDVSSSVPASFTVTVAADLQSTQQGNPTPAAKAPYGTDSGLEGFNIYLFVDFPTAIDFESVAFDYWFTQPANNNLVVGVYYYDEVGQPPVYANAPTLTPTKEVWNTRSVVNAGSDIVRVMVQIGVIGNPAVFNPSNAYGFIDNIRISGIPL